MLFAFAHDNPRDRVFFRMTLVGRMHLERGMGTRASCGLPFDGLMEVGEFRHCMATYKASISSSE